MHNVCFNNLNLNINIYKYYLTGGNGKIREGDLIQELSTETTSDTYSGLSLDFAIPDLFDKMTTSQYLISMTTHKNDSI